MSSLSAKIEAILFWKGEPEKITRLADVVGEKPARIEEALADLEAALHHRGLRLMRVDGGVALVTAPEIAEVIDAMRKEELSRDLGKAGAETLAVVLYRGPATRAEIEYIRGVNCASILRSLLIRGLIDKVPNPERQGSHRYAATADLLAHLGVARVEDLPDYAKARADVAAWEAKAAEAAESEEEIQG